MRSRLLFERTCGTSTPDTDELLARGVAREDARAQVAASGRNASKAGSTAITTLRVSKMDPDAFRRIALGMEHAVEGAHMGHPDFRVHNKIFATIHPDHVFGMVKLTPAQQRKLVEDQPVAFAPENGAWGRAGCTRVHLASVDEDTLGEAMTLAWQNIATSAVARRTRPQRSSLQRPAKRRSRRR
jgi:hypothetical protein